MGLYYAEFTSSPANLLSDINTQLGNASDWVRPNASSRPNTWKATTTRGAQMVVDFAGAAINNAYMTVVPYLSYDGTTLGAAGPTKWVRWNSGAGSSSSPLHVTLSVSKEHLYIDVEGPRASEASPDSTSYGSQRREFYVGDLVPYFSSDTVPTVCVVGHSGNNSSDTNNPNNIKVSVGTAVGGSAWSTGWLATLCSPCGVNDSAQRTTSIDSGNEYLAPYVYFDDNEGIRGRLNNIYFAGWNYASYDYNVAPLVANSYCTYGGQKYKLKAPHRAPSNGNPVWSALGNAVNGGSPPNGYFSPLVAVPST